MLTYDDLRKEQRDGIRFMEQADETLLLADVGTGKTVITLTALRTYFKTFDHYRALICAPMNVATSVWPNEVKQWDYLNEFYKEGDIVCAAGKSVARLRKAFDSSAKIVIINYERLLWVLEHYPDPPFNILVCDEIDKLKDPTTRRFKGRKWVDKKTGDVRKYSGMNRYSARFDVVIGMTGTPTPEHLLNIWAQAYIVDNGKALGKSFYKFREAYFYQTDYMGYNWEVLPGKDKEIYEALAPVAYRIERYSDIPDMVELPARLVTLPKDVMAMYKSYARHYVTILEDGETIESDNAATAAGRLAQIAAGFIYTDADEAITLHSLKYKELDSLLSELQGQQLMVAYMYREQLYELQERYPDMEHIGGGVDDVEPVIEAWNAGKTKLLAIHPRAAAHGLNLQKSGARHIALLSPLSAGLYEQLIGRLRRTGNDADTIFVHPVMADATNELILMQRMQGNLTDQKVFLNAIKELANE